MATTMNFNKEGVLWVSRFTSAGNTVIEIERKDMGLISVTANISGMRPVPVSQYNNGYTADAIIYIKLPAGLEVEVKSETEVTRAQMQVVDAV